MFEFSSIAELNIRTYVVPSRVLNVFDWAIKYYIFFQKMNRRLEPE